MEPKKTQGSFGIPEDMMNEINKSKKKASGEKVEEKKQSYTDSESIPDDGYKEGLDSPEEQEEQKLSDIAKDIKKDLQIEITEDDLWQFLYNNNLTKREITIVPGKMVATFKTISMKENQTIDSAMAEAMEKKLLEGGFRNLNTLHLLSYGLLELGKPGEAKSLGDNNEARFKVLEEMNTLIIEKIAKKWNTFVWLLNYTVNEEIDEKK